MEDDLPIDTASSSQWLDFFIIAGVIVLVVIICLIWALFFRKTKKRKRKYRHHDRNKVNPTLAQIGGLPPIRNEEERPPQP